MKRKKFVSQLTLELYYKGLATYKERRQVEKALKTDIDVQNRYKAIQESEQEFRKSFSQELLRLELQKLPPAPISKRKKIAIGILIAAVLLCALIPTFLYLKHNSTNKDNAIAEGSKKTVDTTEENYFDDDDSLEGFTTASYDPEKYNTKSDSDINIPTDITNIFENMFADRQLSVIVIPDNITSIGKNAFSGNPLVSVTIGANVNVNDDAISGNFARAYNNYGKSAGTYTRPNTNSEAWEKK